MRRWPAVFVVLSLIALTGCGPNGSTGGSTTPPTSLPPSSVVTTTSTSVTTSATLPVSTTSPTTTTTVPTSETPPVLVAARDGAHLVRSATDSQLLVPGRVVAVVDDHQGGLLYQTDAGRDWDQTGAARDTTIWWLPAGETSPIDLLVPSAGHDLTLHDASVLDGGLVVLYTRSEGEGGFDLVDTLRTYDVATREVTQIFGMSAWESGYGDVSFGGDLISGTVYGQLDSACLFLDLSGSRVEVPGDPVRPQCEGVDCPRWCTFDESGARFAYVGEIFDAATNTLHGWSVHLVDAQSGAEISRRMLAVDEPWWVSSLDVQGNWILVNRRGPRTSLSDSEKALPAWVVAADGTGPNPALELPTASEAHLVAVEPTAATSLVLRGDGLGLVRFGRPMTPAMHLLRAVLGEPNQEAGFDDPAAGGVDCFSATGYGCDKFLWWVAWDDGLTVVFSDGTDHVRSDGVPHLVYWSHTGDGPPLTLEGIGPGSKMAELRAALGASLRTGIDQCVEEPVFWTEPHPGIHGYLDGPAENDGTVATLLWAGNAGSC